MANRAAADWLNDMTRETPLPDNVLMLIQSGRAIFKVDAEGVYSPIDPNDFYVVPNPDASAASPPTTDPHSA